MAPSKTTRPLGDRAIGPGTLPSSVATLPYPGVRMFQDQSGYDWYVWVDTNGVLHVTDATTAETAGFNWLTGGTLIQNRAAANLLIGTTTLTEAELAVLDAVTAGTATASKAVVVGASKEIAGLTLNDPIVSNVKVLAADFTANSGGTGATLTNLTGMVWTLAIGTYKFRIRAKTEMTTNGGLAFAFKYTTTVLSSLLALTRQTTASALAAASFTTTTDQAKIIDNLTAAYIDLEIEGTLVVSTGGTLQLQAAQNTSHADTTTVYAGASAEFTRVA